MAGRYDFQSRFGGGGDPWFRAGSLDVNTTVAVVGAGVISMFIWAFEGGGNPLSDWFVFRPSAVRSGQVWRLVTWPIFNPISIWTLLLLAVFFMLGSQLEGLVGRQKFLSFLILLTVGPALLLTLLSFGLDLEVDIEGLRLVEYGVLAAFAAQYPTARFWPNIPAPIMAGIFIVIAVLQLIQERQEPGLIMLLASVGLGLLGIRAMGHADEVPWIPRLTIPGLSPASSTSSAPRVSRTNKPKRSRNRNKAGLASVPPPTRTPAPTSQSSAEIDALLDKIAESGIESLSKPEKARLEAHSKQMRRRNE